MRTQRAVFCIVAFLAGALAGCSAAPSAGGTLTITWEPPKKNTDGTPLEDLAGYTLYYGTAPKTYTAAIPIDDPKATRYVIKGLPPGTYYFALTAHNSAGRYSVRSPEAHGKVGR